MIEIEQDRYCTISRIMIQPSRYHGIQTNLRPAATYVKFKLDLNEISSSSRECTVSCLLYLASRCIHDILSTWRKLVVERTLKRAQNGSPFSRSFSDLCAMVCTVVEGFDDSSVVHLRLLCEASSTRIVQCTQYSLSEM